MEKMKSNRKTVLGLNDFFNGVFYLPLHTELSINI